jgi:general secretion pathway protein I
MSAPQRLKRSRIRNRMRGFTLLEVLVALVIVGTALGASLRAVGSLTQNSDALRIAMLATWSAENRLVQMRLAGAMPAPGKRSVACSQAEVELTCVEDVVATPNARIRRVDVNVYDRRQPERALATISHMVTDAN